MRRLVWLVGAAEVFFSQALLPTSAPTPAPKSLAELDEDDRRRKSQHELDKALLSRARNGDLSKVKELILARADVNMVNGDGWTPLMNMASTPSIAGANYVEVAKELILARTDIDAKDVRGRDALFFASSSGSAGVVELLGGVLDKDANDNYRVTGLNLAVREGYYDVVKALLKIRADPNVKDGFGGTPLSEAMKPDVSLEMKALFGVQSASSTTTIAPLATTTIAPLATTTPVPLTTTLVPNISGNSTVSGEL